MVKLFALAIAIVMSIPASAFAQVLEKTDKSYTEDSSVMGIKDPTNGSNKDPIPSTGPVFIKSDITTEETTDYIIEKSASLSKATGLINFRIAVKAKSPSKDEKLSAIFAINENTDLKDIDLTKVTSLDATNKEAEIEANKATPGILENNDSLKTLALTTEKPANGMVYYLSAKVDDQAMADLDEQSPALSLDIALKEKENSIYNNRYSLKYNNQEESLEEGRTVELNRTESLEEVEADHLIKGQYKEESTGLFAKEAAQITWTDYILSKDDAEFAYNFDLDQAQSTENSQILVEFFEAKDKGYIQNKSFTQKLPFAESINLQIPAGQIAKISLTSLVADAKAKEFTFNGKTIANPTIKENPEKSSPKLIDDAQEEDSILEIDDIDQNAQMAGENSSPLKMPYPYVIEYTSTQGPRYQDGSPVNAVPSFGKNPEIWWDIKLDTSQVKATGLDYNNLYYTLYMGAKDGLDKFKYKVSATKSDLDKEDGYLTATVNSTYLYQAKGNIRKDDLGDVLYIRVKAPLDKSKVLHDEYSLGIRVNPDKNYIDSLVKKFKDTYYKLPAIFKWKIGDDVADKFRDKPFDLLDERIVATPRFRKYDVEDQFYFDSTRSITADRHSDTIINWNILDLIRVGEHEDPSLEKASLNPENNNDFDKTYYRPLINGGYTTTNNVSDVRLNDGSLYPGTIVSYNYKNQKGSQNTRYTLSTNLQGKENRYIDIVNNKIIGKKEKTNPVGGSVYLYTYKLPQSALDDTYFAYYENPFNIMRINQNFDMVVCFNDGIKNPTYNGTGKKVGLQRIENPDGDVLYSSMFGSRIDEARNDLSPGGKFNKGNDRPEDALKDAVKRAYYYADQRIEAWEKENKKKIPRQVREMIYQKMVHHVTNAKPVTEHYALANGWYDPNKNDWVDKENTLYSESESKDYSFKNSEDIGGYLQKGGHRKIPADEARIKVRDNNALEIALDLATKASNDLAESYGANSNWNDDKANSVDLVFYRHGYDEGYQNLITARIHKPLQVDKLDINGEKLAGATFEFINRYTGESKTWTSKEDNKDNPLYLSPGQYYVRETIAPNGYDLLDDAFIIKIERKEVNPDKGPFPLYNLKDIHVNDGYKTSVEIVNDDLFPVPKDLAGNPLVNVENGTLNLKIKNEVGNLGSIEFTKTNGKRLLDGAEFKLTKVNSVEDPTPVMENRKAVYEHTSSGKNGTFSFKSMPAGTYKLEEITAPQGYEKGKDLFLEATEGPDGKVIVNFRDGKINRTKEIVNKAISTELTFRKISEDKDSKGEVIPLDSGVFRLYSIKTEDGSSYDQRQSPSKKDIPADEQTNTSALAKGEFRFTDLVEGDYILVEESAPSGYERDPFPFWSVKVSKNNGKLSYEVKKLHKDGSDPSDVKVEDSIIQITNKARKLDAKFNKFIKQKSEDGGESIVQISNKDLIGEDGEPVSFILYESDYYGTRLPGDEGKIITADENGDFNLKGLKYSTYYLLVEKNPPAGYSKAANTVLYVESEARVSTGKMSLVVRDHTSNTKVGLNNVFEGIIDYELGDQDGDLIVKKTGTSVIEGDNEEVGVRRAYFKLYYADKDFNYADETFTKVSKKEEASYIQRVTGGIALTEADENGEQVPVDKDKLPEDQGIARFEHLKPGRYILEESRGPAGYERDPRPRYILVTKSGKVIKSMTKDDPYLKEEGNDDITTFAADFTNKAKDEDKLSISNVPGIFNRLFAANDQNASWEKVLDYKSEPPYRNQDPYETYLNRTKITEINKGENKFRQVFLLTNEKNKDLYAYLHRQPLRDLNFNDFDIKLYSVDNNEDFDNFDTSKPIRVNKSRLEGNEARDPYTGNSRTNTHIKLTAPATNKGKYLALVVEARYSDYVGLGLDFFYDRPQTSIRGWKKAWAAEKYNNEGEINYKDNDEETKTEVKEKILEYEIEYVDDYKLPKGYQYVYQVGKNGKETITYEVTYKNGKEESRKEVDRKLVEPVTEIVHVGTMVEPGESIPEGDGKVIVDFLYNNMDNAGNIDKEVPTGNAGKMSIQIKKEGSEKEWLAIEDQVQDVPFKGELTFENLDPNATYRIVYQRDEILADQWGLPRRSTYDIDLKNVEGKTFRFTISNGNLLRVYNKDETGFRIPLRVSKKDESGSPLSGAKFKARKIIKGENNGEYAEEDFDAVSEATGLSGDNYFRELSPGIYELTEIQAPKEKDKKESDYELPTDKDGNPLKWYFKVIENPNQTNPRKADYMMIEFDFKHTFKDDDKFTDSVIKKGEKDNYVGKTIYGADPKSFANENTEDFTKLIKLVEDDHRSNPARPDAPYKGINDLEVTNVKKTTKFNFLKVDDYSAALAGAKFKLTKLATKDDGSIKKSGGDYEIAKDKDGEVVYEKESDESTEDKGLSFENIPQGTYKLEETVAPTGFEKLEKPILIKFEISKVTGKWHQVIVGEDGKPIASENKDYNFIIKDKNGNIKEIENKTAYIDLSFTKVDKDGNGVNISAFRLDKVNKDGEVIDVDGKPIAEDGIPAYSEQQRNFRNSNFTFKNLTEGYYRLTETNPTIYQRPNPTYFEVQKDDKTGKLKLVFDENEQNITFTTDKDGLPTDIKFTNLEKTDFEFTKIGDIKSDGKDDNPLYGAGFTLKKVLTEKGAKGKKIYDQEGKIVDDLKKYSYESFYKSGSDGKIRFRGLSQGVYELEETQVPSAYERKDANRKWIIIVEKNKDTKLLEVKHDEEYEKSYYQADDSYKPDDTNKLTISEKGNTLKNTSKTVNLNFNKVNEFGKIIKKDTTFTLVKLSHNPDDLDNLSNIKTYIDYMTISQNDGTFEIQHLDRGLYVLEETYAPEGYKPAERDVILQLIEDDKGQLIIKSYEAKLKYDKDGNETHELLKDGEEADYLDNTKSPMEIKNYEIPNIVFNKVSTTPILGGHKNIRKGILEMTLSEYDEKNKKAGKEVDKYTFDLAKTESVNKIYLDDEKGNILLEDGKYLISETKAPKGYQMSGRSYLVEISTVRDKASVKLLKVLDSNFAEVKNDKDQPITDTGDVIEEGGIEITADKDGKSNFQILNEKPSLPGTGGAGTFIGFAIVGTAVMLAAIAYFGIYQNNKNRRRSNR